MTWLRDRRRSRPGINRVPRSRHAIERRFRRAAVAGGLVVGIVGLVVLVGGWWLDVAVLRQPLPSSVAMRAGTALGLLISGVGIVSFGLRWPRAVTGCCGLLTAAIGVVACAPYLFDAPRTVIESALAIDIARDLAVPGRIAANTALCLLLLGFGLIMLALKRADGVRQAFGVAVLSVAYIAVIGYLAAGLLPAGQYSPQATPMAPLTAGALLVSGFALLFVSLEHGWGRVFAEPLAGGRAFRVALPTALVVFAGFAGFHGGYAERGSNWETAGLAVLAVVMIVGIILMATRAQRVDAQRAELATDLEQRIAAGGLDPAQTSMLLRIQFEGAPNGVALTGADWKSLDVNPALCDMLGYERTDLLGVELLEFVVHPDDRARVRAVCVEKEANRGDRQRVEVRMGHRDGRIVLARLSVGTVRDELDRPLVHICNFEDITDEVSARDSLAERERQYRMVADSSTDAVMLVDLVGGIQWVSPSIKPLFGYDPEDLVGRDVTRLINPMDRPTTRDARARAALGEEEVSFEVRFMNADNEYRWVAGKTGPARDKSGAIVGRITSFHDIQEHVDTRAALGRSEHLLRRAIDGAPQGMAIVGLDLRFVEVNDTLRNLLGRDEAWFVTHTMTDVVCPEDIEADLAERRELQDGRSQRFVRERRWLRADGTSVWVIHSKALLRDYNGLPLCYVSHVQDNTAAHLHRDELVRRVSHDPLTGLINRDELLAHVSALLANSAQTGAMPGLLYCDIDFFKNVNDALGHATGDQVLRVAARRMSSLLRGDSVAARLGGDEFVVVLDQVGDEAAAMQIAERIRAAVSEPFSIGDAGRIVEITLSVGIGLASPGMSAECLLGNADMALYRAKRSGRDQAVVFDDLAVAQETTDIANGLARGEFVPWFAPIVSLADGQVAGYEAVAKCLLPGGGVRAAETFALGSGASNWVSDIDIAIIDQAIDVLCCLPPPMHLAVDISASTLARNEYAQLTIGRLEGCGIDPFRLHLELGEAVLFGATGAARNAVFELAECGVRWYVADFGIGYTSIPQLCDLPIAGVKLDASCTTGIAADIGTGEYVSRALAVLADSLELDTVAQGIRTREQAETLRAQGWQHGQGPLFGLPSPELNGSST